MSYVPKRGDVVWIAFDPQAGHEQAGRRPAVVVSPADYNSKVGLALLCPVTSRIKGYPFEVQPPPGHQLKGAILADQLKSLDWQARNAQYFCELDSATVSRVLRTAALLLAE